MRAVYFASPERRAAFVRDALTWKGTPFVPHGCVRGAGVDCVNVGKAIYAAQGFTLPALPEYSMDEGKHLKLSKLCAYIEATGKFLRIGGREESKLATVGDTLCFRYRGVAHHTGYMLARRQFLHALFGRTFTLGDLDDGNFKLLLTDIYRPLEVAT